MASIRRHGKRWRAQVYVNGRRRSRVCDTKAEASAWALRQEGELSGKALAQATLGQAMARFAAEVSPTHRGERWEACRLRAIAAGWEAAGLSIASVSTAMLADWRDRRLREVSPATVAREMTLLRSVFEVARRDWGMLRENPMKGLRWPREPPSRRRRISGAEIAAMLEALRYRRGEKPVTRSQEAAVAFLLALETAMRAGELMGLTWADVRPKSVRLPRTKNGEPRDVPLSPAARELLALLPQDGERVFRVGEGSRDALWRKARAEAAKLVPSVASLRFHDARAEAIWRLSKKLDVLELARMIGHRDPRSLLMYYQTTAEELADKL